MSKVGIEEQAAKHAELEAVRRDIASIGPRLEFLASYVAEADALEAERARLEKLAKKLA